jgi:hypothetical protein
MSAVDLYLDTLASSLLGGRREIADLIEEVEGGLDDLVAGLGANGMEADDAERSAQEQFGPIELIAPQLQRLLVAHATKRTAVFTALALLIQPLVWGYPFRLITNSSASPVAVTHAFFDNLVEWIGAATLILMLLAVVSARRVRRFEVESSIARAAGFTALIAVSSIGMLGLALSLSGPLTAGVPPVIVALWAGAFMYVPLAVSWGTWR